VIDLSPPPSQVLEFAYPWKKWLFNLYQRVKPGPFKISAYTVATLPDATLWSDADTFASLVYVTNEAGGAIVAFSDGTNWRRVTDRAIVS